MVAKCCERLRHQRGSVRWLQWPDANRRSELCERLVRETGEPLYIVQTGEHDLEAPAGTVHKLAQFHNYMESVMGISVEEGISLIEHYEDVASRFFIEYPEDAGNDLIRALGLDLSDKFEFIPKGIA